MKLFIKPSIEIIEIIGDQIICTSNDEACNEYDNNKEGGSN